MSDAPPVRQLAHLLDTRDWLTNAAQTCAFVQTCLADLNWVGFYIQRRPDTLVLGPFQGQPAFSPIPFSRGVCGAAARTRLTQRVDDVRALSDHIVCDPVSRSELVVPVLVDDRVWGVLDIDSPVVARFSEEDQRLVEMLAAGFTAATDFPGSAPGF